MARALEHAVFHHLKIWDSTTLDDVRTLAAARFEEDTNMEWSLDDKLCEKLARSFYARVAPHS